MKQLVKTTLLALTTTGALLAVDTTAVDVSFPYSSGSIANDQFEKTNILFSNGSALRFDRINRSDVTGPSRGIYGYSFIDSVGTYTYDLESIAPSPDYAQVLSSNAIAPQKNSSWAEGIFPDQNGVDTLLFTSTYRGDSLAIDSSYPGHLLFDHYRGLNAPVADINTFSGSHDWIYCSIDGENSLRFRFLGFEPDSTYFAFSQETHIIQWESDSLGNGIFKGESVSKAVPVQKANAVQSIRLAQNGNTIQLNNSFSEGSLKLFDSRGRLCFTREITGTAVQIPALSKGVYFWEISSGTSLCNGKIQWK